MYARTTTMRGDPRSRRPRRLRPRRRHAGVTRTGRLHRSLAPDRPRPGRGIATSAWETEEAMRASAEHVRPMRERAAEMFGGTPEVQEWEIAVLHRAHRVGDGACARVTWTRTDPANLDRVIRLPGEPDALVGARRRDSAATASWSTVGRVDAPRRSCSRAGRRWRAPATSSRRCARSSCGGCRWGSWRSWSSTWPSPTCGYPRPSDRPDGTRDRRRWTPSAYGFVVSSSGEGRGRRFPRRRAADMGEAPRTTGPRTA